mmetsp:Transcript_22309/g.51075  ORF Transcript_22309/g.51075 Transcript_22309/m.51075 type:complete len:343 (-) Transcript_22309:38-1066(-)
MMLSNVPVHCSGSGQEQFKSENTPEPHGEVSEERAASSIAHFQTSTVFYLASLGLLVLPAVALCIAYIVAIHDRQVVYPYFHPSVAIDYGFPRVLASFVFGLSLPLLLIFAMARYAAFDLRSHAGRTSAAAVEVQEQQQEGSAGSRNSRWESQAWGRLSLVLGCFSGCGMVGVGCVPFHVSAAGHLMFAFLFFCAGIADVAVQLLLLDPVCTGRLLGRRRRCLRQVVGFALTVSFVAVLGSQYMLSTKHWAYAAWVGASEIAFIFFLFVFWATELPTIFRLRFTMDVALVPPPLSAPVYDRIDCSASLPTAQRQRSSEHPSGNQEPSAITLGRISSPLSPLS